ncbi:hypothetical protein [Bacillus sp. S/N-304-OC-R1]|uniref:hypothetical protein n=1 Tax=Bacillus sp. S/N-304-OC-R1 TaxID=2758034 RepID=UPI001C8E0FC1|nr:hypothetical protein [Bacillus sp. S/N-304-OC-R1]MBY0122398.1 hypothetical protein [Bacillus sp. S/N-304-OC-R1]
MKIFYAVEANNIIEDVPEFKALILSETKVFDCIESLFIYKLDNEAEQTELLLNEAGLFENRFELIYTNQGIKGENFNDFGLVTNTNTYLLKELICVFAIVGGEETAIQMAKFQLQEHVIYETSYDDREVFFTEHHLKDLINGIANAYDIQVSFFELDKQRKIL